LGSKWLLFVFAMVSGLVVPSTMWGGAFHSSAAGSGTAADTNATEVLLKEMLNLRQTGTNTYRLGRVELDKAQRAVSIPARVRMRKDVVEYGLVSEQGKGYESVLTTEARPADIHVACLLLGQGQGRVSGDFNKGMNVPQTNAVRIEVAWETNGRPVRVPFSRLGCVTSGRPEPEAPELKVAEWLYNGSLVNQAGFAAQHEGSIISLIRDPVALINNPGPDRDNDDIHFPNTRLLPPEGTAVKVIIRCSGSVR